MGKGRHTIKRGRKRQGGRGFDKKRRTEGAQENDEGGGASSKRGDWAFTARKNGLFVAFYRHLFLAPPHVADRNGGEEAEAPRGGFPFVSEDEWNQFVGSLERDLPTTFRITAHSVMAPLVRARLVNDFQPRLNGLDVGSELLPNLVQFEPLPWYQPLIFHFNCTNVFSFKNQ